MRSMASLAVGDEARWDGEDAKVLLNIKGFDVRRTIDD
jgi:hypothetical protein